MARVEGWTIEKMQNDLLTRHRCACRRSFPQKAKTGQLCPGRAQQLAFPGWPPNSLFCTSLVTGTYLSCCELHLHGKGGFSAGPTRSVQQGRAMRNKHQQGSAGWEQGSCNSTSVHSAQSRPRNVEGRVRRAPESPTRMAPGVGCGARRHRADRRGVRGGTSWMTR